MKPPVYYTLPSTGFSWLWKTIVPKSAVAVTAAPDAGAVSVGPGSTDVATNDIMNGAPATLGTATVASGGIYSPGITFNTITGAISVAPHTPVGTYLLSYQRCDKRTPATCVTGRITAGIRCNAENTPSLP